MTSPWDLRKIDSTKPHTRHISSHNLRMHPCAKLTNPYAVDQSVLGAAVQSNKVYPPRLSSLPLAGIAARQINAIRWASDWNLRDERRLIDPRR